MARVTVCVSGGQTVCWREDRVGGSVCVCVCVCGRGEVDGLN